MHVIESIGPILGIVAFVGLATLAFLLFQQARDIRRLREWAGRAPERAQEAAEAVQAVGEASRGEADAGAAAGAQEATSRGRLGAAWARVTGPVTVRLAALDRRLPVDGRYVLAAVAILVIAAGVLTSGFGVLGGNDGKRHREASVAHVVRRGATSQSTPLAVTRRDTLFRDAYLRTGPHATYDVMPGGREFLMLRGPQAKKLAKAIKPKLGTPRKTMTADAAHANGAPWPWAWASTTRSSAAGAASDGAARRRRVRHRQASACLRFARRNDRLCPALAPVLLPAARSGAPPRLDGARARPSGGRPRRERGPPGSSRDGAGGGVRLQAGAQRA